MERTYDQELIRAQLDRVGMAQRFLSAIGEMDLLNDDDPNRVAYEGRNIGYELYFSMQLFARVLELDPKASEALMLAARSQHICRWMSPREDYPMDREGYLKWRSDLKRFHASKSASVMRDLGYDEDMIERVTELNLKKGLRSNPECQTLEDGLCVVFLEKQFSRFRQRTDEEKMVSILQKSWAKMSEAGRSLALSLPMGAEEKRLVERALAKG